MVTIAATTATIANRVVGLLVIRLNAFRRKGFVAATDDGRPASRERVAPERGIWPEPLDSRTRVHPCCQTQRLRSETGVAQSTDAKRMAITTSPPGPLTHLVIREDPRLDRDATELHAALSELIRVYQFRDREKISRHDVSVTQAHALEIIDEVGPLSMNELAARLFLDKSTTSRVIASLERKGLARRDANPTDRRALHLNVTANGQRLLDTIRSRILSEEKRLLAEFEPAVRREMTRLIGRLARAAAARVDTSGGTCTTIG
jgi:DNA-binding MarR family transcriptional regulator